MYPTRKIKLGVAQGAVLLICLVIILLPLYAASPYLILLLAVGVLWLIVKILLQGKRDRLRGWRVKFVHHSLQYEEFRGGKWWYLSFGCKKLPGKETRYLVYLPTLEDMERGPEQALVKNRGEEIIARIKSKLTPPRYTYDSD
jgi:hypothetical protein